MGKIAWRAGLDTQRFRDEVLDGLQRASPFKDADCTGCRLDLTDGVGASLVHLFQR